MNAGAASNVGVVVAGRDDKVVCGWCRRDLTTTAAGRRFCSRKCRQAAWRVRRRSSRNDVTGTPGVFFYADPPYPGLAAKYYRDEPTFAGEVDFPKLIASLRTSHDAGACLGWALSTSARSLRELLPLCPPGARVCPWVKPHNPSPKTYGLHNTWEPVIVVPGRQLRPGKRDWLLAAAARNEGELPGRKPIAFCVWLYELLGMLPGDRLVDLFPGTGIVTRAWTELSRGAGATSPEASGDGRPSSGSRATSPVDERRAGVVRTRSTSLVATSDV